MHCRAAGMLHRRRLTWTRLGRYIWLHRLLAAVHVYPVTERILRKRPLHRRLRPSGVAYRITSLDQLGIEAEMFVEETYLPALQGGSIETVIDLGCNAGWFALWLANADPGRSHVGLLVDAHPRMVSEARWHLAHNSLLDCTVVHGAVGLPLTEAVTTFHLHPSSSASSVLTYKPGKQLPVKGAIVDVTVPAISVGSTWRRMFDDRRVDLLKIDIEGLELELLVHEGVFLQKRVGGVVMGWHKWFV